MAKEDYKNRLSGLADKMKTETPDVPTQMVVPIKNTIIKPKEEKVEEVQLNTWIPKSLMKKLKIKGLEMDLNQKDLVIKALTNFVEL